MRRCWRGPIASPAAIRESRCFTSTMARMPPRRATRRSEEHTSELQSLMRISYAVFCLKKKKKHIHTHNTSSMYSSFVSIVVVLFNFIFFFFNDTETTEIYTY